MANTMVSIIVPVYNAEKFLDRTIGCVLAQTFVDWELLLVNDGSKDSSGCICDKYAEQNAKIRVFHKENGGVSSARNVGLDNATGEWVCFLDSDDWWEPSYLQNYFCDDMKQYDVLFQGFIKEFEETGKQAKVVLPDTIIEGADNIVKFLEQYKGVHNGFIWQRLFKRDVIEKNSIRFPLNVSYAEDGLWFLQYLRDTNKYKLVSNVGYHYSIRGGSLTSQGKKCPRATLLQLLQGYIDAMMAFAVPAERRLAHWDFVKSYSTRLVENWLIRNAFRNSDEENDFLSEIRKIIELNALLDAKSITFLQRRLLKIANKKNTSVKKLYLKALLKLRYYEVRLASKLKK